MLKYSKMNNIKVKMIYYKKSAHKEVDHYNHWLVLFMCEN